MSYQVTGEEGIAVESKANYRAHHLEGSIDKEVYKILTDVVTKDALSHALHEAPPLVLAMSPERRLAVEKSLRSKIDFRLLPMVVLIYIMNYLDRNNIAAARLAGLESDLGLVGTQYQVRISSLRNPDFDKRFLG
jgi:hypothetical protein